MPVTVASGSHVRNCVLHGSSVEELAGSCKRKPDDTEALDRIQTDYWQAASIGYRRVGTAARTSQKLTTLGHYQCQRVYRIMRQNALLLERKPTLETEAHLKVAVGKVTSGGALTASSSGVILAKKLH